jgi:hypothetical protein
MIIFGRWSLWAFIATGTLVVAAAFAAQHPVTAVALVAIAAILAIAAWHMRPDS